MNNEIPEHIRNMTRRDVIAAVRSGVLEARKLDGTPFMFPESDRVPAKRLPKPKPLRTIVRQSKSLSARTQTYAKQDSRCFYCNKPQHFSEWTLDHKIPVCRGGRAGSNIVGACRLCNTQKACLTVEEFLDVRHDHKRRKELIARIQEWVSASK